MDQSTGLEKRVREIGSEIYDRMSSSTPSLFDARRWKGKVMEAAMRDEQTKVRLFRLIDVLPSLDSDELVMKVFNEYFEGVEEAPAVLRQLAGRITGSGMLPGIAAGLIRSGVESFAGGFIAGKDPEAALTEFKKLRDEGLAVSVDLLGEEVLSDHEVYEYRRRYLDLIEQVMPKAQAWPESPILDSDGTGPIPRADLSLKISSFDCRLDPMDWRSSIERVRSSLAPVLEKAREHGASVTLDMEHSRLKDLTIEAFLDTATHIAGLGHFGIALQAYLKSAEEDVLRVAEHAKKHERPLTIRLVKGAYWDYETVVNRQRGWPIPVFLNKAETDLSFERITKILLENHAHVRPAVATHNIRSISHAIAVADSLELPKNAYEFQMIYGMAEPVRRALVDLGYRVRVYTPVGELIPGMAYLIRRLLENASNESFLRQSFAEGKSLDELLSAPVPRRHSRLPEPHTEGFSNEPHIDFSKASARHAMAEALEQARERLGKEYPLVIAGKGEWTESTIVSLNPADPSQTVGTVAQATRTEAERAVRTAAEAFETWRRIPAAERAEYLRAAAAEMRRERFDLMALQVLEVGKTWREADGDVAEAVDFLEYYADRMIALAGPHTLGTYPGEDNELIYDPKGVGVVISPWNFPLAIPTGMVAASLVTGNCVIFKPSGLSPVCGWKIFEIFKAVGLPAGVLQFLPGPGDEVGDYLVGHPGIDFIAFTGSKETGLGIIERAAQSHSDRQGVKRVIVEMGGKNAIIVDETADLDEALAGVVESAFGYQGQKCSACSRAIVVGNRYDRFCERLKEIVSSLKIGRPEDPGTQTGPLIDEAARSKVRRYFETAEHEGTVYRVPFDERDGYFVSPTVVFNPDPASAVAQEEIFGPVLSVMKASTFDHALMIANGTPYALTGGIYSRSPARIEQAKRDFKVGNLYINRQITAALVGRQPFGGFGMSGVGSKAGGPDYLLQFVNARSISENTLRRGFAPPKDE